jgi:GntR family transcriptional repressor for pyruvate dehydrogenase complex
VALERAFGAMAETKAERHHALDADLAFHLAMARASHNGALIAAITGVREVLRGLIAERVIDLDEALHQHRDILDQIIAGDAEKARASVARHMAWISQTLADGQNSTQAATGGGNR